MTHATRESGVTIPLTGNNPGAMGGAAQGAAKPGSQTTRTALLRQLFEAFNERDVEAITTHYHPAAELWLTEMYTPPGTVYHGREGLRTLLNEVLPRIGVARLEVQELREFEDSVLADVTVYIDGTESQALLLYTFDDDLVRRVEEFPTEADAIAAATKGHVLTPREREVFELLARGRSGPQIAAELFLSPETVRTHVQNGVERLGAKTRVQAVAMALSRGDISV